MALRRPGHLCCIALGLALAACAFPRPGSGQANQALPTGTAKSWVQNATWRETAAIQDNGHPIRYRIRKIDRRGDTTREIIESEQGNVARLVQRDGKPLTAEEDAAERSRLNAILDSPGDFLRHVKHEGEGRSYFIQVIKLFPSAMLFSYAPSQPQLPGATAPQVVIDFQPDPGFRPPTMVSEVLTGLKGRMWIDSRTGAMTRIQGEVLRTVNVGWGVIARLYPGGTIEFEQASLEGKRLVYSHLDEDLIVREMMVHTVNDKTKTSAWDFSLLPAPVSFEAAVHQLLAMQVPLR